MPTLLFYISVVLSLLSQLPDVLHSSWGAFLKLFWIFPFIILLFKHPKGYINVRLRPFYLFTFIFFSYCFIMQTFKGVSYIGADTYNIGISCFITAISYNYWENYSSDLRLKRIVILSLACSAILAYVAYTQSLRDTDLLQRTYAYTSGKNSLGSIILSIIVMALLLYTPKKMIFKIVYYLLLAALTVIIILLRSRATILGLFFLVFYLIFMFKNKRIRYITLSATLITILIIFSNPEYYNKIVNGVLFAGRDASDLDNLSSGRITYILRAVTYIPENFITGIGHKYLDCFPIIMLVQYGIIGVAIVFTFLGYVFKTVQFKFNRDNRLDLATYLLFWIYIINSLFEAQPPFGPGVKCFLLWMLFGFSLAQYKKASLQNTYNLNGSKQSISTQNQI